MTIERRQRTPLGAVVRSPLGVLGQSEQFDLLATLALITASGIDPNAYWAFAASACQVGNRQLFGGSGGPGVEWVFNVWDSGGATLPKSIARSIVFGQSPSVQTLELAPLVAGSASCVQSGVRTHHYAAPTYPTPVPDPPDDWAAYDIQLTFYDASFGHAPPPTGGLQLGLYQAPGLALPQGHFPTDWSAGLVEVVSY